MTETMAGLKRTDYCGELREKDIGREVVLAGWVQKQRDLGALVFVDLRDRTGICQIVFDEDTPEEILKKAVSLRQEFVVAARGVVRERSSKNPNMPTGGVEVRAGEIRLLSVSQTPPFAIEEDSQVNDGLRLKYRYLDLRRPDLQRSIMLRHRVAKITRDYFDACGFLEIETPMLIKSTPEGARDYLVPSRVHPGKFYALPQSPQMYKQLLMLSGYDRYFQIVRCFRDEDLRADRQPEFTQIDLEMSFVGEEDVMAVNEGFLKTVFREALGVEIETPFLKLPYREAMERYGSDKPDLRFGFELRDLSPLMAGCGFKVFSDAVSSGGSVRAVNIEGAAESFSRKEIDSLAEFVKAYGAKGLAWMKFSGGGAVSPIAKFFSEEELREIRERTGARDGDLLLFAADRDRVVLPALGALRCECARRLGILSPADYRFLWVTEFPLLEYDEEEKRYAAMHHPFTSPVQEDLPLLDVSPGEVRARAYDVVLNGVEIGGGSIRIHQPELQEKMFGVLGFTKEQAWARFGFLMEAFKFGPPPHGGLAYGLDRLVMLMAGRESIRDVIAFPKVQNAAELMSGAPDAVDERQLSELSIRVETPE